MRPALTTVSPWHPQVVSYRWLARHFNVPANLSKRVLAQYAEQHKGRVKTTYLVSGWLKVRLGLSWPPRRLISPLLLKRMACMH